MKLTIIRTTCDRCRGDGLDESIRFSIEGREYETELCERHREQLERALAPWVGAARRVTTPRVVAKRTIGPKRRPAQVVELPGVNELSPAFSGGT